MKTIYSILFLLTLSVVTNCYSQIVQPFAIRYQTNQKGSITFVSNTALTCNSQTNGCTTATGSTANSGAA